VDPIPVVMFEPSRSVIIQDSRTGTSHDVLTEVLITAGFHRIPLGPIWADLGRSACRGVGDLPQDRWSRAARSRWSGLCRGQDRS
jgi:hypothetical protein